MAGNPFFHTVARSIDEHGGQEWLLGEIADGRSLKAIGVELGCSHGIQSLRKSLLELRERLQRFLCSSTCCTWLSTTVTIQCRETTLSLTHAVPRSFIRRFEKGCRFATLSSYSRESMQRLARGLTRRSSVPHAIFESLSLRFASGVAPKCHQPSERMRTSW